MRDVSLQTRAAVPEPESPDPAIEKNCNRPSRKKPDPDQSFRKKRDLDPTFKKKLDPDSTC